MSGILSRGNEDDPNDADVNSDDRQAPRARRSHRDSRHRHSRHRSRGRRSSSRRPLPTVEELIHRLESLPRLIALGFIQPAQATAIRGIIDSILRALSVGNDRAGSGRGPAPPIERLRQLLDVFPQGADLLEPLLGDETLAQLFGEEEDAFADENDADFDVESETDADHSSAPEDNEHDES